MAMKYALKKNYLNGRLQTYVGRIESNGTVNLEGMADAIVSRGSVFRKADIMALFENMKIVVSSLLTDGYRVNFDGLVELYPSMQGVFSSPEDFFDSSKHTVTVKTRASAKLKEDILENAKMLKIESGKPVPLPLIYHDTGSGGRNAAATPGNIGSISGHRLQFNADKPGEGIFLVPADGGGEIKITDIQRNSPKELVFLVPPDLSRGRYRLDVRAAFGKNEIRSGRLAQPLTVG